VRILFATSIRTWGGGEEWMYRAAVGLRERGHAVSVAAPNRAAIRERAGDAGLETLPVAFAGDADVASFACMLRHCRARRPDILCLNMDRVLRVGGIAARLAGVPVILPRRGSEMPLKNGWLYRFTYRRIATGMIVNSHATATTLVRDLDWRPAGTIHVLYNGVECARFDEAAPRETTRQRLGVRDDTLVIVVVGELTKRKNARAVIDALPKWVDAFPSVAVWIVGEGEERGALLDQARARGVSDRVHLLGFRADVPDLLAAADLMVHPALVEGFGYAVAEGMASRLPVVASNASSLPEIVDDGSTGFLVDPHDEAALDRAVRTLLGDPELRRRFGEAGRASVARRFGATSRLDDLERLFAEELRARGGRPASSD
jgi:glycosyltransferase involved in cell wall biosynthesis